MLCAVGLVLSGHDAVASAAEPSQQGRINVTMPHRCRGRLSGGWPPRSHIGYPTKSFEAPFLDSSAFPRLSVAGLPKAGSSTLYQLLASHPNLRSAYPEKEHCDFALSWSAAIHAMQVFKARQHEQTRSKRLLNSCICLHCVVCHLTFLNAVSRSPRSLPIQYVVAVREPADRAWATYNYWWMGSDFLDHDPHGHPHHGGWVTRDAHNRSVRSPELFHELVLAGDLIRGNEMGVRRWRRPVFSEMDPWLPLGLLLRLREQAGEANLLLLDTDALGSADTLRRIARFASLDEEPLLSSRYAGMRINAGTDLARRGTDQANHGTPGMYEASDFRPMLQPTRDVITAAFVDDCRQLAAVFGTRLPCADADPQKLSARLGPRELQALAFAESERRAHAGDPAHDGMY